jgi:23S rRNA (guanine2445-N2)-methyltransferase / 23S rRNA (guanine2069-N7)-methyltransferase
MFSYKKDKGDIMNFFATTPKGLELLLAEELRSLGADTAAEKLAGVAFTGDMSVAYKACLWSRLANRILLPLIQIPASTPEELYTGVQTISWDEHMQPESTLLINFVTSQSEITHTLYGAQKVKDAIVDQLRDKYNTRPNIARENPDISVNVYLYRNMATISLDLSGESLHKRGIRVEHGLAPLKENLAAAILSRAGWKAVAKSGGMLVDPMCGSGTFLIEAAQIAGNIAPGLSRDYFGFLGWKKHDAALWETLLKEAKEQQTLDAIPPIVGYDADPRSIKIAFSNIERAGLLGKIHVEKQELSELTSKEGVEPGLVVINPPYGERLGEQSELQRLYQQIAVKLKEGFLDWKAAIFTGNPELGKTMGLRARKHYALFNGAIPCQLLLFDITPQWFIDKSPSAVNERRVLKAQESLDETDDSAVRMFVNRLLKNNKHLKRWAEREGINCYRIYDADLPEYSVAVDRFEDSIVVKEYPAPKSIDKVKAEKRLQHVLASLPDALDLPAKNIYFHDYRAENLLSNGSPMSALQICNDFQMIQEGEAKFLINLQYQNCDAGLPLHQRLLRSQIQSLANGKHCLNLFPRSGTASVAAALGGALSVVSVDESEFFLEWTEQNLAINDFYGAKYRMIQDHPGDWVQDETSRYGLIIVELPDSAYRMREEYQEFIKQTVGLLQAEGRLLLMSRDQRFKFDFEYMKTISVEDLTQKVISPDFADQVRLCQSYLCHL